MEEKKRRLVLGGRIGGSEIGGTLSDVASSFSRGMRRYQGSSEILKGD